MPIGPPGRNLGEGLGRAGVAGVGSLTNYLVPI
jgi:hypothetical protein